MKKIILALVVYSVSAAATEPKMPYSPSLDLNSMNREVQPCENFYQYSCGGWIKKNPIPADQASWDVYGKLTLDNQKFIRELLEDAAKPSDKRTPAQQKIGDYYHACVDEAAIEKADIQPIQEDLKAIAAMQSTADLSPVLAKDHLRGLGQGTLFSVSSDQDYSNSQSVIAFANRAALGLPDRDYYTKTDKKSQEIRAKYMDHLRQSFELLGDSKELAAKQADQVMALETTLAKSMLTRVEMRDPHKLFHKMPMAKFKAMLPAIKWELYLKTLGIQDGGSINVTEPKLYGEIQKQLKKTPLANWKAFMRWTTVHNTAPYLSKRFADSDFEFYGKVLRGVKEQRPRWRRCAIWTDALLGEALGQ
ncbi:MAG: M13 family peptidase, partial [Bdellovibrionales bacterium]